MTVQQTNTKPTVALRVGLRSTLGSPVLRSVAWAIPLALIVGLVLYPLLQLMLGVLDLDTNYVVAGPYLRVFRNTLIYALGSTVMALVIGTFLAWIFSRGDVPYIRPARVIIFVGFVVSEFIYAIAYTFLLDPQAGYLTWALGGHTLFPLYSMTGMVLITGLFMVPQVFILVEPALENLGTDLEEASEACGANRWATLLRVHIPLITAALAAAALLTFLLSFASFGIPAALGVPNRIYVLSTLVFSLIRSYPPDFTMAAALSIPFILVGLLATAGKIYLLRRSVRFRVVGGKGKQMRRRHMSKPLQAMLFLVVWVAALLVSILPLAAVVFISFTNSWSRGISDGLGLHNYQFILFDSSGTANMAQTTITVTVATVVVVTTLALLYALYENSHRGIVSGTIRMIAYIGIAVPPIAFTIGALFAYIKPPFAFYGTIWILVATYSARFVPIATDSIAAGLGQISVDLREAAASCGASSWCIFRTVIFPLLWPVVLAAGMVVTVFALREVLSAVFLSTGTIRMAMVGVFDFWEEGNLEFAAALATLLTALAGTAYILAGVLGRRWRS
ncbi:MAG: ABC transporter permease subunit [Hyphomicrobiales bacterium]|nr:ABC transporter permease subunit [Hyphomicrobiales bacterium]